MSEPPWWQRGVICEIYPRSFQDSAGDGVGDLKGIVQRIDYLSRLGVRRGLAYQPRHWVTLRPGVPPLQQAPNV
jgi:hypothetical protein